MKSFAARERDWIDVEGVLIRQAGQLDWSYIDHYLRPLAEIKDRRSSQSWKMGSRSSLIGSPVLVGETRVREPPQRRRYS
jgi:hypothetical protein